MLWAALPALAAQSPTPRLIHGRVVAAESGDPLRNARVDTGDGRDAPTALTDADGRFTLEWVPPERHELAVARTGYASVSIPIADAGEIALDKGGVITGRVLDDLGTPLALVNVVALRRQRAAGRVTFDRVATVDTDDLGEYRLFGLAAGDYVVAMAPGRLMSATSLIPIPIQNLVLRSFYGPADAPERARPLAIQAGEELPGIDFTMALPAIGAIQMPPVPPHRPGASGAIRGRVLRANGLPVRRGRVQLASRDGLFSPYAAVTDDEGRYEFTNLQAGTYLLGSATIGSERAVYGGLDTDTGSPVTLQASEIVDGIDMTLPRGGVIGGRVLDEYGDPLQDARVRVERIETVRGRRQIVNVGGTASRQTDDHGRYRLFGLPPGRYLITVVLGEDVPGQPVASYRGYARTYFPGTAVPSEAKPIEMTPGQEALTLDVTLTRARVARIAGVAHTADGAPLQGVMALAASARSGALATPRQTIRTADDGAFEFVQLPPGEYVLQAASSRSTVATEGESAMRFVVVDGVDVTGLDVRLSHGSTIQGRLVFLDGEPPPDPDFRFSPVPADPDLAALIDNAPARADFNDDWTFELAGIRGPRRLQLTHAPDGWTLDAVRAGGIDVTDTVMPFGTAEQSLRDVEVVLTTRVTTLEVITADAASKTALPQFRVVAFAAEPARRYEGSRYVTVGVPRGDGSVTLHGLPPGDYYVAAVSQNGFAAMAAASEGEFLESLAARATRVTLTGGGRRSVSVNVIGR